MGAPVTIVFQFHYGTIKSIRNKNSTRNIGIFQFHYGTIKSIKRLRKYLSKH